MLLLAVLMILAISMAISAVAFKSIWLGMIAGAGWILASLRSYTLSLTPATGVWDIYYGLFFIGIFLGVLSGLGGYAASKQTTIMTNNAGQSTVTATTLSAENEGEEDDLNDDELESDRVNYTEGMKRHRAQYDNLRIARKHERKWRP